MDPAHFDRISKLFAARRLSRRRALRAGGAGLAVALGPVAVAADAAAQTGTPTATPEPEATKPTTFMFVQSFAAGALVPQTGKPGMFTLTLRRGIDQTIYFSDRPERLVGMVPTDQFVKGLGFGAENPPNAALVARQGPGREDIVVLELMNPRHDASTASVTYDVKLLQTTRSTHFNFTQAADTTISGARAYGASSLFIDDCPDGTYCCVLGDPSHPTQTIGDINVGTCWNWSTVSCKVCDSNVGKYCNQKYPACNNQCNTFGTSCGGFPICCPCAVADDRSRR